MSVKSAATSFGRIAMAMPLLLVVQTTLAGIFSTGTFTGDADSGVALEKFYTHAVDIWGANPTTTVNGVPFTSSGQTTKPPSGLDYSSTGFSSTYTTSSPLVSDGGMKTMLTDFAYGATDNSTSTLTLSSLSSAATYVTNFYVSNWSGPLIDVSTSLGDSRLAWNRGTSVGGGILRYTYSPGANNTAIKFTFAPHSTSNTCHFYAFSNEVVSFLPGLYNTGVDDFGIALANGVSDSHWKVLTNPAVAVPTTAPGAWVGEDAVSTWLSTNSTAIDAAGGYTYTTTFDLTDCVLSSPEITGRFLTDDNLTGATLNGTPISTAGGGFTSWGTFDITSGFVAGLNTLEFTLNNGANGYTGFRAEFTGASGITLVPEPGSIILLGLGGIALLPFGWRRRKQTR